MSYISYIREQLFPAGCGGCGEVLLSPTDAWFSLCEDCRAYLSQAIVTEKPCEICGRPLILEKETCVSCRQGNEEVNSSPNSNERPVKVKAIFPYTGKFREILGSYKFGKSVTLGNFFVQVLVSAINGFVVEIAGSTNREVLEKAAWVPVPPRPGKKKSLGWDQIDYLAGILKKEYKRSVNKLPVNLCLKRLPSRSQKELNREGRRHNLKRRILCTKTPPQTAILFDDVITTGATLKACAEALFEGGAARVYAICLFYD